MSYLSSRIFNLKTTQSETENNYADFLSPSKISINENKRPNTRNESITQIMQRSKSSTKEIRRKKISIPRTAVSVNRSYGKYSSYRRYSRQNEVTEIPNEKISQLDDEKLKMKNDIENEIENEKENENEKPPAKTDQTPYEYYQLCDWCGGDFGEKLNPCKIININSIYYMPLWCFLVIIFMFTGILVCTIYLGIYYQIYAPLGSYSSPCTSNSQCNRDKNLYCRINNASSQDYCNCPAPSLANTCDCPSTYYWNGITCTKGTSDFNKISIEFINFYFKFIRLVKDHVQEITVVLMD